MAGRPPLSSLDPGAHLRDPTRKPRYVAAVFALVAPSYDRFTRWFSFGMDARWKRRLARWATDVLHPGDVVVDLACGTGHVGAAVRRYGGGVQVVGVDRSRDMLTLAARRGGHREGSVGNTAGAPLQLTRADLLTLPLKNDAAAVLTAAYGFRNVADLRRALAEAARVLRPGGWLFDLDFFLPERAAWRRAFRWYLRAAGRAVGGWWHDEPEAYGYIDRSLEGWLTASEFSGALREAGFRVERVTRRLGGGIALHAAQRRGSGELPEG